MQVKLKKLRESDLPEVRSAEASSFKYGEINTGVSLPVEYECEGYIRSLPQVGAPLFVLRNKRHGVESLGIFRTSPLVRIQEESKDNYLVETANSVYHLEVLWE